MMKSISRMTEEQTIKFIFLQTLVLAFNTGCLIDAMIQIERYRKALKGHKRAIKFLTQVNDGLVEIAANPKADPIENRQAIVDLVNNVKADMILGDIDMDAELEKFRE